MAPDNMNPNLKPVDVICQFDREGVITPLKVRITDEDGEYQSYRIEEYIELKHTGANVKQNFTWGGEYSLKVYIIISHVF